MTFYEDDVEEAQEELLRRMGILSEEEEPEDLAEEELADLQREQLRAFLLGERKDGISKE